jgi:hypothetical protein
MTYRSIIDGQSGAPFIAEALAANGPLIDPVSVPAPLIEMYRPLVPALILDVWEHFGIGDLGGGRMRLYVPRSLQSAVDQLFAGDPYLGGDTYALAYGAFGDLVAWNRRHQMVYVNMQLSSVDVPALINPALRGPDDQILLEGLLKLPPGALDAFDDTGTQMFDRAVEHYGALPPLHIYGMHPPAPRNEAFSLENHRVAEVDEWLSVKIAESVFKLDDPAGGRFGLRTIGPDPDGKTPAPAGEL